MEYETIAGIDKPVSRIVQGVVMMNAQEKDERFALLDAVLAAGINAFDSAHVYNTDQKFGEWVNERGVREKIVLQDKCAHHNSWRRRVTPYDITADLHDLLVQLEFEYIDLYVMHRDDPAQPVEPIVEVMNEHIQAGLIRAYGGSNWSHERVAEANEYAAQRGLVPFAVSSPHFSLAEMIEEPWDNCLSIAGAAGAAARRWYAEHDVTLMPWSTLCGGFWSGRYDRAAIEAAPDDSREIPIRCYRSAENVKRLDRAWEMANEKSITLPQLVIAYSLNQPLRLHPLVAAWKPEEVGANVKALEIKLTEAEMAWLDLRSDER